MRKLGVGHIVTSIDGQIRMHQEAVQTLENMKKHVLRITSGSADQIDEMEQQDAEMLKDFVVKKFGGKRHKNVDAAVEAFKKDPKLWIGLLNEILFVAVRPALVIKTIREVYEK